NHYRTQFRVFQHLFEAGEGMIDFKFRRNLGGSAGGDVCNRQQFRFRNAIPKVLRMAAAHLSNPKHSYTKLVCQEYSPESYRFDQPLFSDDPIMTIETTAS